MRRRTTLQARTTRRPRTSGGRRPIGRTLELGVVAVALAAAAACGSSGTGSDASDSVAAGSNSSSGTAASGIADPSAVSSSAVSSSAVSSSAPPSSMAAASPADYYDCLSAKEKKNNFRSLTVGDLTIDAVEFGTGKVGVLLSHQSNGDLCQWHDYALTLAERGYRVILPGYQLNHYVDHALAAIDQLRKDGATSFVLIGASMGGTISLATAPEMTTPPKAVVSLSGPADFAELDVSKSVAALTMPVLFAAGANDSSFAEAGKQLYASAKKSKGKQLLIDPGNSSHGVDLLTDGSPVAAALDTFLTRYAPAG